MGRGYQGDGDAGLESSMWRMYESRRVLTWMEIYGNQGLKEKHDWSREYDQ